MQSTDISTLFTPPLKNLRFWQWQDDGDVVAWNDGSTIAFAAELRSLQRAFDRLPSPRIGSALLVLAACRENQELGSKRRQWLSQLLIALGGERHLGVLDRVATGLDELRSLPAEHRQTLAAKSDLLLALYERLSLTDALDFQLLSTALRNPANPSPWADASWALVGLRSDLDELDRAFENFDPSSLPLRRPTGLDELPEAAAVEMPFGLAVRRLLESLDDDRELGGMTRIARQIMAAAQLPRRLEDRDELPVGGVCDIAPRGPLDRLLLSELAQDDLVLSVRVALNEAMYFRREAPPRSPPRRRWVLVDAGVRTWGVPRVFAAGVALAFAATDSDDVALSAFRSAGAKADGIELHTKAGLLAHLAALDYTAHCGPALQWLIAKAADEHEAAELVVITEASAAADPNFQRTVESLPIEQFYLATVDRDGHFELHRRSRSGQVRLSQASLDLDELLRPRKRSRRLFDARQSGDLPAIYFADPFPLRLCANIDPHTSWFVHEFGLLSLTSGKQLLHWERPDRGAQRIDVDVPHRSLRWCSPTFQGKTTRAIVGPFNGSKFSALQIDTETRCGECVPLRHDLPSAHCVAAHGDTAFLFGNDDRIAAVDLNNGRALSAGRLHAAKHVGGRFVTSLAGEMGPFVGTDDDVVVRAETVGVQTVNPHRDWWAISYDGTAVRFDRVYCEQSGKPRLITMFDVVGVEGPVGVTDSGNFYYAGSERTVRRRIEHSGEMSVQAVARDGRHIQLVTVGYHKYHQVVDTRSGELLSRGTGDLAADLLGPAFAAIVHGSKQNAPRRRFSGVVIRSDGQLALVGRRQNLWPIDAQGRMELAREPRSWQAETIMKFDEIECPAAENSTLQMATLPNGGRAWLDALGMLHLRGADADLPEITIVLREGESSGWCSDGRRWGSPFFIDDAESTAAAVISQQVYRPLLSTLT